MNGEQLQIEPDEKGDGVWLWRIGVFPPSSVLAGQTRRQRVKHFATVQAAQAESPAASVKARPSSRAANREDTRNFERSPAPAWFNPAIAGEEW